MVLLKQHQRRQFLDDFLLIQMLFRHSGVWNAPHAHCTCAFPCCGCHPSLQALLHTGCAMHAHVTMLSRCSCKVVRLDDNFFSELHDLVVAHHRQQAEAAAAAAAAASETQGLYPTMQIGTGRQLPPHGDMDGPAMVANSFMSGEGFGNPLTRPPNVVALQEVLVRANAKPGHMLTQIVMDHCDKGSLQQAIKRGLFRCAP